MPENTTGVESEDALSFPWSNSKPWRIPQADDRGQRIIPLSFTPPHGASGYDYAQSIKLPTITGRTPSDRPNESAKPQSRQDVKMATYKLLYGGFDDFVPDPAALEQARIKMKKTMDRVGGRTTREVMQDVAVNYVDQVSSVDYASIELRILEAMSARLDMDKKLIRALHAAGVDTLISDVLPDGKVMALLPRDMAKAHAEVLEEEKAERGSGPSKNWLMNQMGTMS